MLSKKAPRRPMLLAGLVLLAVMAAAAACSAGPLPALYDFDRLIADLRAAGATVELTSDQNIDHGFGWPARRTVVNGENVYVYEFADELQAAVAAGGVSPNGYSFTRPDGPNKMTTHVDWLEPPHFYRRGRLVVIYAGRDAGMKELLAGLLGSPFAGSETNYLGQ